MPPRANADHFDVFDDTFRPQSAEGVVADGSLDSAVSYDSDAYNAFLRSDGLTGELSAMKNDWLRRMRCDIADQEAKYKKLRESVASRQSTDPKADPKFAKDKFLADEMKQEHATMSVDTEEGNVSALYKHSAHHLTIFPECHEDIRVLFQSDREISHPAGAKRFRQVNCSRTCLVSWAISPCACIFTLLWCMHLIECIADSTRSFVSMSWNRPSQKMLLS